MRWLPAIALMFCMLHASAGWTADTQAPAPKYEALRSGKVAMHAGPGRQYPVLWIYQRKGLPVKILATYDKWHKVSDLDGTTGWIQETMLTEKRTVTVAGATQRVLRHDPQDGAATVAMADPGAIARVTACQSSWCHVKFDEYDGWMKQAELWGTDAGESFEK